MNQKKAKLIKKIAEKHNLNYSRLKKVSNTNKELFDRVVQEAGDANA